MAEGEDRRRRLLSGPEMACLHLLAEGATDTEIASRLSVSPATVANDLLSIDRKLGVRNRLHAIAVALHLGLLTAVPSKDP